jgi:hypothetical protein
MRPDVESSRVFRAAGIPLELANDPMIRLPATAITRLSRVCVDATNNPYFGLVVAIFIQMPTLHALGYALAASSTLMDFCRLPNGECILRLSRAGDASAAQDGL